MANVSTSPNDPLFYLHHCNIDRLWAFWQGNHPGAVQYPEDSMDTEMPGGATPRSMMDHQALDYMYPRDTRLEAAWTKHANTEGNLATEVSGPTFYGNPRSKELHTVDCPFFSKMRRRVPFNSIQESLDEGYNGCFFCLREHDTG